MLSNLHPETQHEDTLYPTATDTHYPTATDTDYPTATDTHYTRATYTHYTSATDTHYTTATDAHYKQLHIHNSQQLQTHTTQELHIHTTQQLQIHTTQELHIHTTKQLQMHTIQQRHIHTIEELHTTHSCVYVDGSTRYCQFHWIAQPDCVQNAKSAQCQPTTHTTHRRGPRGASRGTARPRTGGDVDDGEQPHPHLPVHRPLLRLQVRLAAVVHEARVVAAGAGVDDAVLVHSQHVEVGDVVLVSLFDPTPALVVIDQVADILVDKLALIKAEQPHSVDITDDMWRRCHNTHAYVQ